MGFKKNLGWKDLSPLNMFSLDKRDFKNVSIENKFTFKTDLLSKTDLCQLENLCFTDQSIYLNRSTEWLKWRLIKNPINEYYSLKLYTDEVLSSVIIFKNYLKSIDIMEIFTHNDANKFEMLKLAFSYLLEQGVLQLNCWSNLNSDECEMMQKMGFKEGDFNTNFGIIPFVENEKLLDIKNWHYRFIDSDVF